MKRVLSMVVVFMLFLVLQPISANAAPSGTEVSGDWKPYLYELTDSKYYLSADATLKSSGKSNSTGGVTIDLNGHTLTIDDGKVLVTSYVMTSRLLIPPKQEQVR